MLPVRLRLRKAIHDIEIPVGEILLWAAKDAGVPIRYGCTEATCGKCVCRISGAQDSVSAPGAAEYGRLGKDMIDKHGFRLACQLRVYGACEVEQR